MVYRYLSEYKISPITRANDFDIFPVLFEDRDTVMYIVNYTDGWEILSGDRRLPIVLISCDHGSISERALTDNPLTKDFYNSLKMMIASDSLDSVAENHPFSHTWETLLRDPIPDQWILVQTDTVNVIDEIQEHLTETKWGQGPPWNERAPKVNYPSGSNERCVTGCGPVAIAQLLYYLHNSIGKPPKAYGDSNVTTVIPSPTLGQGTVQIQDNEITLYSPTYLSAVWDLMPLSATDTSNYFKSVSTLMVEIGYYAEAVYSKNSTSTNLFKLKTALSSHFHIECDSSSFSQGIAYNQVMQNQEPVVLSLSFYTPDPSDSTNVIRHGHDVLIDACKYNVQLVNKKYAVISWNGVEYVYRQENLENMKFGINWGYDGIDMFDSGGNTIWYDAEIISWSGGGWTFTNLDNILYDFE